MAASSRQDLTVIPYKRSNRVADPTSIVIYVNGELQRIEQTLGDITDGTAQVVSVAPRNPRRGTIRYAIAPWNPGSGEGLYVYKGSVIGWKFIV